MAPFTQILITSCGQSSTHGSPNDIVVVPQAALRSTAPIIYLICNVWLCAAQMFEVKESGLARSYAKLFVSVAHPSHKSKAVW